MSHTVRPAPGVPVPTPCSSLLGAGRTPRTSPNPGRAQPLGAPPAALHGPGGLRLGAGWVRAPRAGFAGARAPPAAARIPRPATPGWAVPGQAPPAPRLPPHLLRPPRLQKPRAGPRGGHLEQGSGLRPLPAPAAHPARGCLGVLGGAGGGAGCAGGVLGLLGVCWGCRRCAGGAGCLLAPGPSSVGAGGGDALSCPAPFSMGQSLCPGTSPVPPRHAHQPSTPFAPHGVREPLSTPLAYGCSSWGLAPAPPAQDPQGRGGRQNIPPPGIPSPPRPTKTPHTRCLHTCHVHSRHYRQ